MRQLICEMCGGTDLIKQDGVFVCQSCGCKYSVEEARKMMVEGTVDVSGSTVKVDKTDSIASLIKRTYLFLEEGNWEEASAYSDKVLDLDPEYAEAYLTKLMSQYKVNAKKELANCKKPFDENTNYKNVIRFAQKDLRDELTGYVSLINARIDSENKAKKLAETKEAEEIKTIAKQIVAAFRKERDKNISLEDTLSEKTEKLTSLMDLLNSFDEQKEELVRKKEAITTIDASIKQLSSQRENLGFFSGRDKKRIDEQLADLESKKEKTQQEISVLTDKFGGCDTKTEVESAISTLRSEIISIEKQIEEKKEKGEEELSFEQAWQILCDGEYYTKSKKIIEEIEKIDNSFTNTLSLFKAVHGDTKSIVFGAIKQSKPENTSQKTFSLGKNKQITDYDDKEPIEWYVLQYYSKGKEILVISKYILCIVYN